VGLGSVWFTSGSELAIAINGTTVDTAYDQLHVVGIVNSTGVKLFLSGTYAQVIGDKFTLVNNDGSNDVVGEFNGLHDGNTFRIDTGA